MKELELINIHRKLGGKIIDFAGFAMPVQYFGIKSEHLHVRNSVGLFDVSHMGQIFIEGDGSFDFLQFLTSNDLSKLKIGQAQYTYLPNEVGGVIDDLLIYMLDINKYLLVVNASNISKNMKWLSKNNSFDCKINNHSENYSLLAIQGPKSIKLLNKVTNIELKDIKYYNFKFGNIGSVKNVLISRTGYTGEIGFELYVKNNFVKELWDTIFSLSEEVKPIGLAARDTLRLEKGYCLYGNELNDETSPFEAGLSWITSKRKKFIGGKIILEKTIKRKLVGLELLERGVARKDYDVFDDKNKKIGIITSGTMSPSLNKAIALGFISIEYAVNEKVVFIKIRNNLIKSKIVSLPFI